VNIVLKSLRKPFFLLLLICKEIQWLVEHGRVDNERCLTLMEAVPSEVITHDKIEIRPRVSLPAPLQFFHPILLNLLRSPFVKFVGASILWILLHKLSLVLKHLINRHIMPKDFGHLSFIKITFFSFVL
jgi:hypothetical protein